MVSSPYKNQVKGGRTQGKIEQNDVKMLVENLCVNRAEFHILAKAPF
jgi:hypothetical protein